MITVSALPKRGEKVRCLGCGLSAPQPIVLPSPNPLTAKQGLGRCANREQCERRQRRARNRAKAAT